MVRSSLECTLIPPEIISSNIYHHLLRVHITVLSINSKIKPTWGRNSSQMTVYVRKTSQLYIGLYLFMTLYKYVQNREEIAKPCSTQSCNMTTYMRKRKGTRRDHRCPTIWRPSLSIPRQSCYANGEGISCLIDSNSDIERIRLTCLPRNSIVAVTSWGLEFPLVLSFLDASFIEPPKYMSTCLQLTSSLRPNCTASDSRSPISQLRIRSPAKPNSTIPEQPPQCADPTGGLYLSGLLPAGLEQWHTL